MRRIAFMNQKGGVGKTTTVANLGAALVDLGHTVLVVDVDPQANLTAHLDDGLGLEESRDCTIYDVLVGRATATEAIVETSTKGLHLLPSTLDLSGAEVELAQRIGRESILRDALDAHFQEVAPAIEYDFLLLDCPPSLGLLSLNALTTALEVMIPIQTQFFALRGMSKLLEVIDLVKARLRPELTLTAIIPAIADMRTKLTAEVLTEIRTHFGDRVTRTLIRTNVRLAEAPSYGKTIFQYDRSARGAMDYRRLALELTGGLPPDEEDVTPGAAPRVVRFDDLPTALPPPGEPPGKGGAHDGDG